MKVMFRCIIPDQELPHLDLEDMHEFSFLSDADEEGPTPVARDGDRVSI